LHIYTCYFSHRIMYFWIDTPKSSSLNSIRLDSSLHNKYLINFYVIPESTFFTIHVAPPSVEKLFLKIVAQSLETCSSDHCDIHINLGRTNNVTLIKSNADQITLEGFNLTNVELALCGTYTRPGKLCSCLRALKIEANFTYSQTLLFRASPFYLSKSANTLGNVRT